MYKNYIKQLSILVNNSVIGSAASYILTINLANYLGATSFGLYSYILIVATIIQVLVIYATDISAPTMAAGGADHQRIYNKIITFRCVIFVLVIIILLLWPSVEFTILLGILALSISAINLSFFSEIKRQNTKYSFIYMIERLLYVALVFTLIFINYLQLIHVFIIYFTVTFISLGVQYNLYSDNLKNYSVPKIKNLTVILYHNLPLVLITLSSFAYGGISRIILEDKLGLQPLGIFSAGMQLTALISIFQAQVDRVWRLPLFSALVDRELPVLWRQIYSYLFLTTLPVIVLAIFTYLYGGGIVSLLFIQEYGPLKELMPQFSLFFILINVNALLAILWIGFGARNEYLFISVFFGLAVLSILKMLPSTVQLSEIVMVILSVQALQTIVSIIRLSFIYRAVFRSASPT
ncbi:MAG: oligosaccharide flippase family protein [Sphingomonadales bacterium]|nr:oligosaccharide flippase family protein [Sphingomonadales bacterium]